MALNPVYTSVMECDMPSLDHLSYKDYDDIYEPAEDTFLFIDVLNLEKEFMKSINPSIAIEIG